MNERIKELAEQASFRQFFMPKSNSASALDKFNGTFTEQEAIEKFVELIVNECVGILEGGRFLHDEAPTAIFARECSTAIKRHFGVE